MAHYAALDVSSEETAIHVIDEAGRTVWRGKRASDPEALAAALCRHAPELVRVGLETVALSQPDTSKNLADFKVDVILSASRGWGLGNAGLGGVLRC